MDQEEDLNEPQRNKRAAVFSPNSSTEEHSSKLLKPEDMPQNSNSNDCSNEAIMRKLSGLDNRFDQIETKIDDVKGLFNNLREKTVEIDNRLSSLESTSNKTFSDINNDNHCMRAEMNQLRQITIQNDFIMYGLPPQVKNEDLPAIFDSIGAILGQNLMVLKPFAINSRKKRETVVFGTFKDTQHKKEIFALKKQVPVPIEDIISLSTEFSSFKGKEIVFKNRLTQVNQAILTEANKTKNGLFKYAWDVEGRVHLKMDDNSKPILITSLEHLRYIIGEAKNRK